MNCSAHAYAGYDAHFPAAVTVQHGLSKVSFSN